MTNDPSTQELAERHRLEQALRDSNSRLEAILHNTTALIYIRDAEGRYVLVSHPYEALLDKRRDEIVGRTAHELFPPETAERFWQRDLQVLRSGVPMEFEETAVLGDEERVYLSLKFPIVGADGVPTAVCGIASDITDRKRTERRLAAQHATSRILAECSTLNDATPRIIQALCQSLDWDVGAIWSIDEDSAVLRCVETWRPTDPRYSEFEQRTRQITFAAGVGLPGRVWKCARPAWILDVTRDPNFPRGPFAERAGLRSAVGFPIILHDQVLGVVEFFSRLIRKPDRDVMSMMAAIGSQIGQFIERQRAEHALRESEQRLQSILDNTTAVIYAKDRHGRYILVNRQYERLFHVDRTQVVGRTDYDFFSPELADGFRANDLKVWESQRALEFDERAPHDGVMHDYLSLKFLLSDAAGQPYALCGISSDITERKQVEEALKHERYLLHTLMDNVPDAIYFKDAQSRFLRINRALAQKNGLADPAQAIGKTDSDFFTPEHARPALEDEQQVMRTGQPIIAKEEPETWPDGRVTWVLTTKLPLRDPDGHIVGTFGISRDITTRKQDEAALRDSEALYHSLVESLPLNLIRKDLRGRVTLANSLYCKTMGRSIEQLLGRTDHELFPAELADKYRQDDLRVIQGGCLFETIEEHQKPNGERIFVQVLKSPVVDSKGQCVGTQVIFWDVTARQRAEEALQNSERRYRQFTEGSQDAIVVADHLGRITLFNAAAERTFGYDESEVRGHPVTVLMPPEFIEPHQQAFARYLATREPHVVGRTVELRGRRKNGEIFHLDLSLTALDLPEGVSFLAAIRDTTERHRMQARLIQSEKMASLGLMSAGVAHEINNPLAFVANNLAVLDRDVDGLLGLVDAYAQTLPAVTETHPDDAARLRNLAEELDLAYVQQNLRRILDSTRQGVKRVADIVQNLRNFARVDQATVDRIDVHDAIRSSLEMIQSRLARRNIAVVTDYQTVPRISCSPAQLNQVFLNLLVNAMQAIEAAKRSAGRIAIATRADDRHVAVEIADDGCGIPAEQVPKIFDPFFTTKKIGEGTGLGLSITHGIVRDHHGEIEVESKPGEGTRFRVLLPISPKDKRHGS